MERHNVISDLESCQDIYRNYLKKTQHLTVGPDGHFPPADRKEWVAARRAARFYSRKISRELKKARAALALLTPAHYKYQRSEAAVNMLEMRLEFALAVQNAIDVAKTAQTTYAEKEIELSKENVFKVIAPDMLKAHSTDVATTNNPLGSRSGSFHSNSSIPKNSINAVPLTGSNPMKTNASPPAPPVINAPNTAAAAITIQKVNVSDDSVPTDPASSASDVPKPVTDADFEFDNLYNNNSTNVSLNYSMSDNNNPQAITGAGGGEDSNNNSSRSAGEARPTNPSVPSMSNPLRDKAKSFRQDPKPSVPAQQTSGGQLANKIYSSETKSPNALNRSMINIRSEEEKEKEEAARKLAESKAHELSPSDKEKDKNKPKNPFKAFGKTISRMFNLTPVAASNPAPPAQLNRSPTNNTSPKAAVVLTAPSTSPNANANNNKPTFYTLKTSSDEFDTRPVVVSPKVAANAAANSKQKVDHIINTTSSFAEARRVAKNQAKAGTLKEGRTNSGNEYVNVNVNDAKAMSISPGNTPRTTPTATAAATTTKPLQPGQVPVVSTSQLQQQQRLSGQQQQQQQPPSQQQQVDTRHQQALLYAQQRASKQQQQQGIPVATAATAARPVQQQSVTQSRPQQQVNQVAESTPTKGSIEQLRAERDNLERLMKVADDLISQAKLTENRYNTTPQYWPKVNEAWEECVVYCEKEFDRSVDRFKNEWNRKLTYVIKEKHRWNDKMKRLQEYDYIAASANAAAVANGSSNNAEGHPSRATKTLSVQYSSPPTPSGLSGGRSQSMYEIRNSTSPPVAAAPAAIDLGPAGGPNKLEKLQDKLQRNKVKSILEKAIIITNSAKYELSKRAIVEAKQSWNEAVSLYEQSYQAAPEAFKDWWREELANVKKQRDDHLATLVEKTPISMSSVYNMEANPSTMTSEIDSPSPNPSTAESTGGGGGGGSVNFHRVRVG